MSNEELISRMRARLQQVKRVLSLAHDPMMIEELRKIVESGEADIRRLEQEHEQAPNYVPPPKQR